MSSFSITCVRFNQNNKQVSRDSVVEGERKAVTSIMADLGTDIIRIHLVNGDARTVRFEEGADSSVS